MKWNIPNALSLLRIALLPIIVVSFYLPWSGANYLSAALFLLSGLTDWLDGLLARKLDQMTRFGAFIDPVADKLMVTVVLILLIEGLDTCWMTIPAMIIIGRELVVSALREWMAEIGEGRSVAVNFMGKLKTFFQMGAILTLLVAGNETFNLFTLAGLIALYLAALLTIFSKCIYLYDAVQKSSVRQL